MARTVRHGGNRPPESSFRSARWDQDLDLVRRLFVEYRQWLAEHQDPAPEARERVSSGLALVDRLTSGLPGAYGPPRGDVVLWFREESVVACGALRELEPTVGEIRRIFVRPDFRGKAFGHPFVRTLLARARALGYGSLKADTLPSMQAAIEFYQELGFRPTGSFWPHPVAGALFFERQLSDGPGRQTRD